MYEPKEHLDPYEEEERLANLYVACTQLHESLEIRGVVNVILEICVNLIGAARAVLYIHEEERGKLVPVAAAGGELPAEEISLGEGDLGEALKDGAWIADRHGSPAAMVPMVVSGRTVGAVVVEELLPHKESISSLDRELFGMLSRQGATALYGACLASKANQAIRAHDVRSRLEG